MKEGRKPEHPEKTPDDELQNYNMNYASSTLEGNRWRHLSRYQSLFASSWGQATGNGWRFSSLGTVSRFLTDIAERVWAFASAAVVS